MAKSDIFIMRITPEDKKVLQALSEAARLPMSEVVRRSVLQASVMTLRNA